MKTKWILGLAICLGLMSCTLFSQIEQGNLAIQPPGGTPGQAASQQSESGSELLPNPDVGLDALTSYHQELSVTFDGQKDGQPYAWTNTYKRDFWKEPAGGFLLVKTSETGQADSERLIGSLDQAHYSRARLGDPCLVTWGPLAKGSEEVLEPASMLPAIGSANEAGQDQVNGVSARHYSVSATLDGSKLTGEVWLAQDGGYVVRYQLAIQGDEKTFGTDITGEQKFTYELTQVDALGNPAPPQGCPSVLTDFPVLDDAQNLHRLPNGVDYTSQTGVEVISQFYQDQLKQQGWTLVSEHKTNPQKPVLIFVNADKKQAATILLDASEGSGVWVSAQLRAWEPAPTLSPDMQIPAEGTPDSTATPGAALQTNIAPTVNPSESGLPEDIPLYPGVTVLIKTGGVLKVDSSDPVDSVVGFYLKQMPSLGWTKISNISGETTILVWQKSERIVTITVAAIEGKTTIMIIQPPQ